MKKICTLLLLFSLTTMLWAQDQTVNTVGTTFVPADITIFVGQTVEWVNTGGSHNVNGTQSAYPGNPESFGNSVGTGWTYQYTFNTVGQYNYHCDPHVSIGMTGTVTVMPAPASALVIAGVADPQPANGSGGNMAGAKTVEFYVLEDIADLSEYGLV